MPEKVKQNKWRLALTLITFIAFVLLIIFSWHQIINTLNAVKKVNILFLWLIIPFEILNYDAQARLYRNILKGIGVHLSYKFLYIFSLELNFVSTIFPSGGLSGFSYTSLRLKSKDVPTGQSTLVQLLKFIAIFFAFQALLILALILLAAEGKVNELILAITSALIALLVALTVFVVFIIGSEARINGLFVFAARALNGLINLFRSTNNETIEISRVRRVFTDLHQNYLKFRDNPSLFYKPLLWAMVANVTEIAVLYAVYAAFGHWVNPGAIILAYAVANFAGAISVLPGGIGVYETLMTVILAAAGISPSLSIPVTVMYRILNTIIQLAPGYVFYERAVHDR